MKQINKNGNKVMINKDLIAVSKPLGAEKKVGLQGINKIKASHLKPLANKAAEIISH